MLEHSATTIDWPGHFNLLHSKHTLPNLQSFFVFRQRQIKLVFVAQDISFLFPLTANNIYFIFALPHGPTFPPITYLYKILLALVLHIFDTVSLLPPFLERITLFHYFMISTDNLLAIGAGGKLKLQRAAELCSRGIFEDSIVSPWRMLNPQ